MSTDLNHQSIIDDLKDVSFTTIVILDNIWYLPMHCDGFKPLKVIKNE